MNKHVQSHEEESVDPDMADLAEEDIYEAAPPNLCGSGFKSKTKDNYQPQNRKFLRKADPLLPKEVAASRTEGDLPGPKASSQEVISLSHQLTLLKIIIRQIIY